jgi:hypothetical protein
LLARGLALIVVVVDPPPSPDDTPVVVEDEPGTGVEGEEVVGELTAKFEPVTRTTSALCDVGRAEPTSMVALGAEPVARPALPRAPPEDASAPLLINPGS